MSLARGITVGTVVFGAAWILVCHAAMSEMTSPETIALWPEGAPGAVGTGENHTPTLTCYMPPKERATGAAIVVCPGGGYHGLALDHEGEQVARWLVSEGIAAFVLRYRHAPDYRHPVPLMDAQRAIRSVRARATEWGCDPARVGMLGFSAGGHLTATAGTQFDAGDPTNKDPIERVSSRPDFLVLVYPVITLEGRFAHRGSRENLLGTNPDPNLAGQLCAEKRVTKDTPPAFLVHSSADTGVPAENSILFYRALREAGVPAELHIFEKGEHGFGLAPKDPALSVWPKLCIAWLHSRGILK